MIMIIIDYHSTLIDKDYHCQYKPHTFSRKKQKALQKDPSFCNALFTYIIHIRFPLTRLALLSHAERKRKINLKI